MKKLLLVSTFIIAICLSAFAGNYISDQNNLQSRNQKCKTMISFAIDKLENLKNEYDTNLMEALISNVYAAYTETSDGELASALHQLWNALMLDGENIIGKENDLIKALQDTDPNTIKGVADSISKIKNHNQ